MLTLQTDPLSPERGQYAFVQAIVRTIAYETIGRRERKRRHLASARHLESVGGEELTEVVAAHYVDAYRLAPDDDDAAEIRDSALRTLVRAAERAASLAAPGEAERLIGSAIDLTEDDRERAALLERAGIFALTDGQPATADGRLTEAAAAVRAAWRRPCRGADQRAPGGGALPRRPGRSRRWHRWSRRTPSCANRSRTATWRRWPPSSAACSGSQPDGGSP